MSNKWFYINTFNLIVIYIVGICGVAFTSETHQQLFLQLTPLNLIVTTIFTLLFHSAWNRNFIFSGILIFLVGFFIEVIGVKTHLIFGNYWYGKTLGLKLFEVPVLIGLNWFLLIYIIATSFQKIKNIFLFAFLCAATMTLLDIFIEPIAVKLDFWQWQNGLIPMQNYAAWFILSFLLFLFFRKVNKNVANRFSVIVLAVQFLFFAILYLLLN